MSNHRTPRNKGVARANNCRTHWAAAEPGYAPNGGLTTSNPAFFAFLISPHLPTSSTNLQYRRFGGFETPCVGWRAGCGGSRGGVAKMGRCGTRRNPTGVPNKGIIPANPPFFPAISQYRVSRLITASPFPNTPHFGGFEEPRIGSGRNVCAMGTAYGEIGTSGHIGERPAEDYDRDGRRFSPVSPISRFALCPPLCRRSITTFSAVTGLALLVRREEKGLRGTGDPALCNGG